MSDTNKTTNPAETIIGLKTNCARGYSLADFWMNTHKRARERLVKTWSMIDDSRAIEPIIWEEVDAYVQYKVIDSGAIGIYSTIKDMIIPAKDYITKKGVAKHKPEERIPSHYDQNGKFLGRVSTLGDKPISYQMKEHITPTHFKVKASLKGVTTLEDCFEVKSI